MLTSHLVNINGYLLYFYKLQFYGKETDHILQGGSVSDQPRVIFPVATPTMDWCAIPTMYGWKNKNSHELYCIYKRLLFLKIYLTWDDNGMFISFPFVLRDMLF